LIKVINRLTKAIRSAAVYNPDVQAAPACILWPNRDRQWEAIIPRMQIELLEIFVLGHDINHTEFTVSKLMDSIGQLTIPGMEEPTVISSRLV